MSHDLSERILTATILDGLDRRTADDLLEIHLRVMRDIFCPITGRVLDSRTAHLIRVTFADSDDPVIAGVVDPPTNNAELTQRLDTAGAVLIERFDPKPAWDLIR